jgi:molybdenum cofactor guanylyltransferase
VLGAVLCGGASRRMGVDKATMLVGGVPMAASVAAALAAAGCTPVVAVGGEEQPLRDLGLQYVADDYPGQGPLGAIITVLRLSAPATVVACDVPNVSAATLVRLADALGDHHAAVARSDRPQPLCAVWGALVAKELTSRFSAGERAMHLAIAGLDIAWVDVAAAELRNVNTPDDLNSL